MFITSFMIYWYIGIYFLTLVHLIVHALSHLYYMVTIVLHAHIVSTFECTNTYFMPTLFHSIGIGDYLFLSSWLDLACCIELLVSPHAPRTKPTIFQLMSCLIYVKIMFYFLEDKLRTYLNPLLV